MLIVSHPHLGMPQFDTDRRRVVSRASKAGVQRTFTVGVDVTSSRHAVTISRQYPLIHAVVGVHPHNAKTMDGETLHQMHDIAQDPRVKSWNRRIYATFGGRF